MSNMMCQYSEKKFQRGRCRLGFNGCGKERDICVPGCLKLYFSSKIWENCEVFIP